MALLPCSHSCPPMLVPLFGDDGEGCDGWRTALSSQGTNSPRTWCSSAISPSSFRSSLVILRCFPPRLGPWAYYSKWAGVPRPFGPTIIIYLILLYIFSKRKKNLYIYIYIYTHTYIHTQYLHGLFFFYPSFTFNELSCHFASFIVSPVPIPHVSFSRSKLLIF